MIPPLFSSSSRSILRCLAPNPSGRTAWIKVFNAVKPNKTFLDGVHLANHRVESAGRNHDRFGGQSAANTGRPLTKRGKPW